MLDECKKITAENVERVVERFPVPYSFLRVQVKPLPEAAKPKIARYMTLDHLIWYHEELASPAVDTVLSTRLAAGEAPELGYGKLMERLLYFRSLGSPIAEQLIPIAERRLRAIHLSLERPVACFGDASYSMDVAIRCSTIIGSVLACLTGADLQFFTDAVVPAPVVPRTIREVLRVVDTVAATGLTAPAAALWPLYRARRAVKFLIMVTDEVENVKADGEYWPSLYKRYVDEVAPECTAVFVSFLPKDTMKGRMVAALDALGVKRVIQFRLDSTRPDLTKLDTLLGILASESNCFPAQIRALTDAYALKAGNGNGKDKDKDKGMGDPAAGLDAVIERLKSPLVDDSADAGDAGADDDGSIEPPVVEMDKDKVEMDADAEIGAEKEKEKDKDKEQKQHPPPQSKQNLQSGMCVICFERKIDIALMGCGHACVCEECSKTLTQCPMCRGSISSKVKVYIP